MDATPLVLLLCVIFWVAWRTQGWGNPGLEYASPLGLNFGGAGRRELLFGYPPRSESQVGTTRAGRAENAKPG